MRSRTKRTVTVTLTGRQAATVLSAVRVTAEDAEINNEPQEAAVLRRAERALLDAGAGTRRTD
jgi:hypothetical protein